MRDTAPPAAESENPPDAQRGSVDVSGQQVHIGRDVVGGTVQVAGRDINISTTRVGFGPAEIQRLLITVGGLLAVMFLCGFSGGIFVGANVLAQLKRDLPEGSTPTAARQTQLALNLFDRLPPGTPFNVTLNSSQQQISVAEMDNKLQSWGVKPPGASFDITLSEQQISPYVHRVLGPQLGLTEARVRFLEEPARFVAGGQWAGLGNLQIAAAFRVVAGDHPLQLESAAVRVVQIEGSDFGWVAAPGFVLQPLADQVNNLITGVVRIDQVVSGEGGRWVVSGVKR